MRQRPNLRKNAPGRRPPEGGAEQPQQFAGLLVRAGGGHDGDVHAANLLHLVVVDLGKDQLLLHAEVQVAAAIESPLGDSLEVFDPRQGHTEQLVQEVVHPVAARGDLGPDGHPGAQLEVGDRLLRPRHQRPLVTRAKKSIANFKLRPGVAIGAKVTPRGDRMYDFLDKLFSVALPRIKDFKGISERAFDGRGNLNLGMKEQLIFPENDYDKVEKIRGMDITIVTTARTDEEARELLRLLGLPLRGAGPAAQGGGGDGGGTKG